MRPRQASWRALRLEAVLLVTALALVLALRLLELTRLPAFLDETMYIGRALRAIDADGFSDLLYSVTEGKSPLLPWLLMPSLLAVPDRLLAARLVSAIIGLANGIAFYALARPLFGPKVAVLSVVLYALSPLTLFYDRLALYDNLLLLASLATFIGLHHWSARPTVRRVIPIGVAMGLGLLTKLSIAISLAATVPVACLLLPRRQWRVVAQLAVAYTLAAGLFSIVLLHPEWRLILDGNSQYALTLEELLRLPVALWLDNANVYLLQAPAVYLTPPVMALGLAGAAWCVARRERGTALVLWVALQLLALVLVTRMQYTRYELFALAPVLILAARAMAGVGEAAPGLLRRFDRAGARPIATRTALALATLAVLLPSILFDHTLVTRPASAPLATVGESDRYQYIEGWPSGYGLEEAAKVILHEAQLQPVLVVTWSAKGIADWAQSRFDGYMNVYTGHIFPEEPMAKTIADLPESDPRSRVEREGGVVYYVQNQDVGTENEAEFAELNPEAQLVGEWYKPGGKSRVQLFRVSFAELESSSQG